MKRVGVDQVARALIRFGVALVSVAAALLLLQATPLWAQTTSVTCTSATGLPYDPSSSIPSGISVVVFDYDTQACIIKASGFFTSPGSMRFQLNEFSGSEIATGYVWRDDGAGDSNQLSRLESCDFPGGTATPAGANPPLCEAKGTMVVSGNYVFSNTQGGDLVTMTVSVTVAGLGDYLINSATVVIGTPATSSTPDMIGDYLGARNSFILNHQPDRSRRLARFAGFPAPIGDSSSTALGFAEFGTLPVSVSLQGTALAFSGSAHRAMASLDGAADMPELGRWDIWSEGRFSVFDDDADQSGDFGIVHVGADYLLSAGVLIGAKAQVDWGEQAFAANNGTVSGIGVMVGPYATVALSQTLFLDVAGSLGVSSNDISPIGTYTDEFDTTRWMVDASLVGQFHHGAWTLRPVVTIQYIAEHQEAYTDSLSVRIEDQTVSQGQVSLSPYLSRAWVLDGGVQLVSWIEGSGHYAFGRSGTLTAGSYADQLDGLHASVRAGLDVALSGGATASLAGQYGGLGTNAESYGGSLAVSLPLN